MEREIIYLHPINKHLFDFIMSFPYKKYKNIIFDLGGVILNIDFSLTIAAFQELGISNFENQFSKAQQSHIFDLMDKGLILPADFRSQIRKLIEKPVTDTQIDDAWNKMLLNLPKSRLDVLKKMQQSHRTFLFSNTNQIHIEAFYKYLNAEYRMNDLSEYFEKVYLSNETGMRKPEPEIFNLVLQQNSLLPHETLFIDDTIQYIEAAKSLGIQTYWLDTSKESITDIFI